MLIQNINQYNKRKEALPRKNKIIDEKVDKLLKAKFIREAQYSKWIVNVVMVKKEK